MKHFVFACALFALPCMAQQSNEIGPSTFHVDGQLLLAAKTQKDASLLKTVREEADNAMHTRALSVTAKSVTPPSGDKHDYMSLAPYFWPNPATADHLPYIRRDGERNPQIKSVPDHENMTKMEEAVHALAMGYYFTGQQQYAAKAVELVRAWYLNPDTRMNPNLRFAQAVLGVNDGRGTGILEARDITQVLDGLALLTGSTQWTGADQKAMEMWLSEYYTWLTGSKNGRDEAAARNNHGSWYDEQAAGIALFLGRTKDAREILLEARAKRIAKQIQKDGEQPLEQARTKSFDYCLFNLRALMQLADYGERIGVDLWRYKSPDGGSIEAAIDYLRPFALGQKKWEREEIDGFHGDPMRDLLIRAAFHLHRADYLADALRLSGHDDAEVLLLRTRMLEENTPEKK